MTVYLIIVGIYLLSVTACAAKFFDKTDQNPGLGYVPLINLFVWLKVIKRPLWWFVLLLFPGVNFIMMIIMNVEMGKAFGFRSAKDQWLSALLGFIYLPYIAYTQELEYIGPENWEGRKKSAVREWGEAIVFAIVAASMIRSYFLEAFTIPTSSMEKSMLIGDYLFVSKLSYGPKIPQTPLAIPFVHHTLPIMNSKSYSEFIQLPHFRLPGFGSVERNDVVVFNYPDGDTVVVEQQNRGYQQILRDQAFFNYKLRDVLGVENAKFQISELEKEIDRLSGDMKTESRQSIESYKQRVLQLKGEAQKTLKTDAQYLNIARKVVQSNQELTVRPVDKRENYIKRCVGIPGDELEVKNGQLFINKEPAFIPQEMQYNYNIKSKSNLEMAEMKDVYNVNYQDYESGKLGVNEFNLPLTNEHVENFKKDKQSVVTVTPDFNAKNEVRSMTQNIITGNSTPQVAEQILVGLEDQKSFDPQLSIFPNNIKFNWTEDNFGPLVIPKKGETVQLTLDNLPLYERVIHLYENNTLIIRDNKIYINDVEATSYTFKMDYYFMMGDNRHNSADSRFWGFVPEDHVVGKAVFVWLSLDKEKGLFDGKIRWNRIFSFVE